MQRRYGENELNTLCLNQCFHVSLHFSSWSTLFFHKQTLNGLWCRTTGTTWCHEAVNYFNDRWCLKNIRLHNFQCYKYYCVINITKGELLSFLCLKLSKSMAILIRKYSGQKRIMQLLSQLKGLDGRSHFKDKLAFFTQRVL